MSFQNQPSELIRKCGNNKRKNKNINDKRKIRILIRGKKIY